MSLFSESDVASIRSDRLIVAAESYFPDFNPSDDYILGKLQSAEQEASRQLKTFFEPTVIFPYTPSDDEVTALEGAPYAEEPGYDYDPGFFQGERWGYIVTRARPIISVEAIQFAYPNPTNQIFAIPLDWLRLDKKYGHIRMVPASSTFIAPLGAFLLQALGGGMTIPSMIQVKYTAGLTDATTKWLDLIDVIKKKAVLSIIQDNFLPSSASISADGLSQSMSVDTQKYEDLINLKMFGPKGANGGLWTAIHGIGGSVLGVAT